MEPIGRCPSRAEHDARWHGHALQVSGCPLDDGNTVDAMFGFGRPRSDSPFSDVQVMQKKPSSHSVRLLIAKDGSSAELVLPPDADSEHLTYEWCHIMLQEASIEITDEVRENLRELLGGYVAGQELRGRIATGQPVKHGEDGYIEWEEGLEPADVADPEAEAEDASEIENPETAPDAPKSPPAAVCFYSHSAFTMVTSGQRIGRVVPPSLGCAGRDVRGLTIPAYEGKPVRVKFDESISLSDDGVLTSCVDGVLSRSGIRISVREFLEITGNVDFSTGHIDFEGDAKIHKGIRDLFEVRATGNIEIGQLIEAATVEAGGDIYARGGIAGRERGKISAKGDMTIRYLDSSSVSVGGTLRFEREMINCNASVMGSIESPGGAIIGGEITVVGRLLASVLGSSSQVVTTIHAASVPMLEDKLEALRKVIEDFQGREEKVKREITRLAEPGRVLSPDDRVRVKELGAELKGIQSKRTTCEASSKDLAERIASIRTVDINIEKMLHAGVRIVVGNQIYRINKDLKGPLRILLDRHGEMVYRIGTRGQNLPLRLISEIRAAAA